MALSHYEIQKKSDKKRGVVTRGYTLPLETVSLIKQIAADKNMSQAAVITEAVKLFQNT